MNVVAIYVRFLWAVSVWSIVFFFCHAALEEFLLKVTFPFLIYIDSGYVDLYIWVFYGCFGYFLLRSFKYLSEKSEELSKLHSGFAHRLSRHYTKEERTKDIKRLEYVAVTSILWGFTVPRMLVTFSFIHAFNFIPINFYLALGLSGGGFALSFVIKTASNQRSRIIKTGVIMQQGDIEKRNRVEIEELQGYIAQQKASYRRLPGKKSPQTATGLLFPFLEPEDNSPDDEEPPKPY